METVIDVIVIDLSKITDIRFSHGICDLCMEKHFPDVLEIWSDEKLNLNNQKNIS